MTYTRAMVWEVYEGVKVEDGGYKHTRLWGNLGRDKNDVGRMRRRVGRSGPSKGEKYLCDGGSSDWILWRPKGKGSLYLINEGYD